MQRIVGADCCIFPVCSPCNQQRQADDARCCYIPACKKRRARVSFSLRSAATHHFPCACALLFLFGATRRRKLWQKSLFFAPVCLLRFFPLAKHTPRCRLNLSRCLIPNRHHLPHLCKREEKPLNKKPAVVSVK
jgi:hypothetical protein